MPVTGTTGAGADTGTGTRGADTGTGTFNQYIFSNRRKLKVFEKNVFCTLFFLKMFFFNILLFF